MADLETLDDLHRDQLIGKFDAAVIDKQDGKPHIVKRLDRPAVRTTWGRCRGLVDVPGPAFVTGGYPGGSRQQEIAVLAGGPVVIGAPAIEPTFLSVPQPQERKHR